MYNHVVECIVENRHRNRNSNSNRNRNSNTGVVIARAACSCKMLVKNRFQPARPAGRPAPGNLHNETIDFGPFF